VPEAWIDGLIVFLIGSSVGVGELVARYRDEPRRAILTRPAMLYVGINGFASIFALVAIRTFGWTTDAASTDEATRLVNLLLAGFGAMAVFRTSLFVVRVGTNDVGVGPVAFLQILLGATDRGVDRKRASERAEKVVRIMGNLDPSLAYNALPAFAIMLMQNLTLEDQQAIGDQVKALAQPSDVPEQAKILNVGLLLMNFVGEEVLEDAVRGIRGQLKPTGVRLPAIGSRARPGAESEAKAQEGGSPKESEETLSAGDVRQPEAPNLDRTAASTHSRDSVVTDNAASSSIDIPPIAPDLAEHMETEPPSGKSAPGTALPPP
jgi:hypothetical protein